MITDVTDHWKGDASGREASRNAGCWDLHQKERDEEVGGNWRREGRLMVATTIANDIFAEILARYRPTDVSEVIPGGNGDVTSHAFHH